MNCNLHSHTTFCDGEHSPEEMLLSAIEKGCSTYGFSGHAPSGVKNDYGFIPSDRMDAYCNEIIRLKKKYSEKIEVLLGIEQDFFSPELKNDFDYIIGSVHYIWESGEFVPMDVSFEALKNAVDGMFSGDAVSLAERYYETVAQIYEKTHCDIVGHFDIVTKYNEKYHYLDEDDKRYKRAAIDALDLLLSKDVLVEVNTGAMKRGWRTTPYPADFIIKRVLEKKGRLILGSDCHHKDDIFAYFEPVTERLKALGVTELWVCKNGSFLPQKI